MKPTNNVYQIEDDNVYTEERLPVLFLTKLTSLLKVCRDPLKNTTSKGRGFIAITNILFSSCKGRKDLFVSVEAAKYYAMKMLADEEDKECCHVDAFVKKLRGGIVELKIRLNYRYPMKYQQKRSRY